MFFTQTTLRATISVCAVLLAAIVGTGFITSAYKRERESLGQDHFEQGSALAAAGHMQRAVEQYRQALIYSPDDTNYRLSLARALIGARRLSEARSHLEQLLQEDPTNGVINLLLARVAVQQNKPKQAIDYYQRAVYEYWPASALPERREARWELVRLLEQTGNRSQLVAELMQLYSNAPEWDKAQIADIGFLLLKTGATSEASEVFRDLAKSAPKDADARRGLGAVAFNNGDFVAARHEFQRALRLKPTDEQSGELLGLTNEVIDLHPGLPHISSAERLRRSSNLLTRVIKDLQACVPPPATPQASATATAAPGPQATPKNPPTAGSAGPVATNAAAPDVDPLQQRLDSARALLQPKRGEDANDRALDLQDAAQQLWKDRAQFCGQRPLSDRPVEIVLPILAHE